jgi:hypothetical protein
VMRIETQILKNKIFKTQRLEMYLNLNSKRRDLLEMRNDIQLIQTDIFRVNKEKFVTFSKYLLLGFFSKEVVQLCLSCLIER